MKEPSPEKHATPTTPQARPPISWRRNLFFLWLAQLTGIVGFSFIFPFIPLFVQDDLGVVDPARAALWSGIAGGAMAFAMFFVSPVWGFVGDRYGRKKNVLRAMFGSAIVMVVTGLSGNVYQLVLFRFLGGLFSGTFSPTMALAVSSAPRRKTGYVTGVIQTSFFVGNVIGPLFGGFVSEVVGFRATFYLSGVMIAVAGLLVLLFVREDFHRPATSSAISVAAPFRDFWRLATARAMLPLLFVIFLVQISMTMMFPVLPVLIKELSGAGSAASQTGIAFAVMGGSAATSAFLVARLSERVGLTKVLVIGCLGAGALYGPIFALPTVPWVLAFLGMAGLFQGGLAGSAMGLVGLAAPRERHGAAYAGVQSASSLAFGFGPLLGGALATGVALRSVFLVQTAAFFLTALLVARVVRLRREPEGEPDASRAGQVEQPKRPNAASEG